MNPQRHEQVDLVREAEIESNETTQRLLREIAEDARRLKNRYPKDTLVTEGGE